MLFGVALVVFWNLSFWVVLSPLQLYERLSLWYYQMKLVCRVRQTCTTQVLHNSFPHFYSDQNALFSRPVQCSRQCHPLFFFKYTYRIPRVFGDKFCDKFGDLFGDSPYFVINLVTMLVTYFLSHQTCHNFWWRCYHSFWWLT